MRNALLAEYLFYDAFASGSDPKNNTSHPPKPCILFNMDTKVIIYGADWCGFCHEAMHYLDRLGVKYTYKNVEHDENDLRAVVEKSGQTGIPVIDIEGQIIIGFDRPTLDRVLKDKKLTD